MCTGRHLELMASYRRDLDLIGFLAEVEREVDQDAIKKVYRTLFLNMDHWNFYFLEEKYWKHTLPITKMVSENRRSQKDCRMPTTFQARAVSFKECKG